MCVFVPSRQCGCWSPRGYRRWEKQPTWCSKTKILSVSVFRNYSVSTTVCVCGTQRPSSVGAQVSMDGFVNKIVYSHLFPFVLHFCTLFFISSLDCLYFCNHFQLHPFFPDSLCFPVFSLYVNEQIVAEHQWTLRLLCLNRINITAERFIVSHLTWRLFKQWILN